uniref:DNA2/NAM7 helicase helicase domain-containing protein n=1 Tax=Romanomermis culicivorax TaxID=13658 RepID=A0A915J6A0_ROMCU
MAAYQAMQENMSSYTQRLKPVLTPLQTYGDDIEPPIQAEVEDEKARKFVTLVTAPSNAAVDNILARLIRHQFTERQHCKIVRVYSTEIEQLDFPEPHRERRSMTFCINVDHRQYALHHQLRQNVRFGEKIRNSDIQNRRKYLELVHNSNMPEPDQDESFMRVIKEGEKEILRDADIILTTCSTANWIRLKPVIRSQSFDQHGVRQLIIYEAGHSTIMETLISLCTAMNTDNIVLIGDPKQLRPVLKSKDAQAFKFDYSLLDIYHKDIAAFPSIAFYKDQMVIEQPDIQPSRNLVSPFKWADNNAAIFSTVMVGMRRAIQWLAKIIVPNLAIIQPSKKLHSGN